MLDATETEARPAGLQNWRDTLIWGDVLAFRFPHMEGDETYRPKARPCVVLDVVTIAGQRFVTLGYGTSSHSRANRGYEVWVSTVEALAESGIDRPTRFVCSRRITVSDRHPGFCLAERGTPVIGRLAGAERERLNDIRARIFAEADIAAEIRERRRSRRQPAKTRPPIVEYRRPRSHARPKPRAAARAVAGAKP